VIFHAISRDDDGGPPCVKCGSTRQGVSTVQRRDEFHKWGLVTICEPCLFRAVLGDTAFARAVNNASLPLRQGLARNAQPTMDQYDSGEVKPRKWWQW
jgi:hypothetical protein